MNTFYEVEVSDATQTVAGMFSDLETAKAFADDCEQIVGVRIVVITGPYRCYGPDDVQAAYLRAWNMLNEYKGD